MGQDWLMKLYEAILDPPQPTGNQDLADWIECGLQHPNRHRFHQATGPLGYASAGKPEPDPLTYPGEEMLVTTDWIADEAQILRIPFSLACKLQALYEQGTPLEEIIRLLRNNEV